MLCLQASPVWGAGDLPCLPQTQIQGHRSAGASQGCSKSSKLALRMQVRALKKAGKTPSHLNTAGACSGAAPGGGRCGAHERSPASTPPGVAEPLNEAHISKWGSGLPRAAHQTSPPLPVCWSPWHTEDRSWSEGCS